MVHLQSVPSLQHWWARGEKYLNIEFIQLLFFSISFLSCKLRASPGELCGTMLDKRNGTCYFFRYFSKTHCKQHKREELHHFQISCVCREICWWMTLKLKVRRRWLSRSGNHTCEEPFCSWTWLAVNTWFVCYQPIKGLWSAAIITRDMTAGLPIISNK